MEEQKKKKGFKFPSAYTVLLLIMIVIAIVTQCLSSVKSTSLAELAMAPANGMIGVKNMDVDAKVKSALQEKGIPAAIDVIKTSKDPYIAVGNEGALVGGIDVAFFVLIIGGFLGVVTKTGALDAGVNAVVKKLKGREILVIPVLMFIFSLGGTSYGMAEESLAFYALLTGTMMAAGFDSLVGAAVVLLGAGCGVLGSTVNPFAVGAAVSAAGAAGVKINQGTTMLIGAILWFVTLGVSIVYVMNYAKKVREDKNKSILSGAEIKKAEEAYANDEQEEIEFTTSRKIALVLFGFSFIVMILGVMPLTDLGINAFEGWSSFLTGSALGHWWFGDLTVWFFLMAVVIGLICRLSEKDIVDSFIAGASDMVGVALVIGVSRGVSFMMTNTGLDLYILNASSHILSGVSGALFSNMAYLIYIPLSFLIPSTSGLASVSMPIFAPLAQSLNIAPELVVGAFIAGCGIVNLITPTSGVVMGGLAISKVEYATWIKFVAKLLGILFIANMVVLGLVTLFI